LNESNQLKHNQREKQSLARHVNDNPKKTVKEKYWDADIQA
jgi:hypothetical protein